MRPTLLPTRAAVPLAARLVVEAMEPRLLHSADLPGAGLGLSAGPGDALLQPQLQSLHTHASSVQAASTSQARHEVVLIDTGLPDAPRLLADLKAQQAAGRALTVVTMDAGTDGLAALGQALQGLQDVAAVHVVGHGSDGVLALGGVRLDQDLLLQRAAELAAWSDALADDADLLLYGCDLAASDSGRAFLADLAALTGADVAASTDPTGASALGGDWDLEARTGAVQTPLAFSPTALADFSGLLVRLAYDGFGTVDGNLSGDGAGSGWADVWNSGGNRFTTTSTNLASPSGTLPTSGGSVTATLSSTLSAASATRDLATTVGQDGSTTWISFLVRPNRTGLADFMGLEFGANDLRGFVGYNGSAFILGRAGALTSAVVSGVSAQSGQAALLVLKLESQAGNDVATLYVNPTPGLAAPLAANSVTVSNLDFGSFSRLAVSAGNGFGINNAVLDELRVGTSYTDVAPTKGVASPVITSDGGGGSASLTVKETVSAVTTVAAFDPNGDALTYGIVGGTDASRFTINASSGALAFAAAPDFEAPTDSNGDNVYQVQVRASDGSRSDTQTLSVTVTDVSSLLVVNTFADVLDAGNLSSIEALNANPGADGKVSLREAVIAANNTAGRDSITLQAGTYALTLAGAGENLGRTGDLDIRDDLTLQGAGMGATTITGGGSQSLLHVVSGSASVSDLRLADGYTMSGGAAVELNSGATLALSRALLSGNASLLSGGAILSAGALSLTDVELRDNTAASRGGGLYHTGSALSLERVTLAGNQAGGDGAGAWLGGTGLQSLRNVTFSGNQTSGRGGALFLDSATQLESATLANNNASSGGALYVSAAAGPVTLRNTLLVNSGGGGLVQQGSAVRSLGHNQSSDTVPEFNQPGDRNGVNAALAALADHGGLTRTHALGAGSSAIDAGDSAAAPATDQRGSPRLGAADVGAYEYVSPSNTAPVFTSHAGAASVNLAVAENTRAVTTVRAVDADGQTPVYSLAGGADAAAFVIDSSTGQVAFASAPDFERPADADTDNLYQVVVQASDGIATSQQTLLVQVSDVAVLARDDSASATSGVATTINVLANDSLGEGTQLRLVDATSGGHAASLSVSSNNLVYTSQAGYNGIDTLRYLVVDGSEGLVHHWNLSGHALDSVGSAHGSLSGGPTSITGVWGSALRFDGNNDRAAIPDFSYSNEFTLSFWFRMADNNGTGLRYIYAHGDAGTANSLNVYFIEKDTSTASGAADVLRTRIRDGNDADDLAGLDIAASGLADNQWHQYTLSTRTGGGSQVYIDGVLRAAISAGGDAINPSGNLVLGTNVTADSVRFYQGDLDSLQFYSRAVDAAALYAGNLGQAEVVVNVASGSGAAPVITSGGGGETFSVSVAENTGALNPFTTITATDAEAATIRYGLVDGGDAALFGIDPATGALRFLAAPDFEAPRDSNGDNVYTVTVSASDGSNADLQTLTISVTDVGGPLVVTTTADTVDGDTSSVEALLANPGADGISLREALLAANASAGADTIAFNLAGTGPHTLQLLSALPTITDRLSLDASTQPGFAGSPRVVLNGASLGAGTHDGLVLGAGSSGSVLRGLVIHGFSGSGIVVTDGSGANVVAGNWIGLDATGLAAPGNGRWGIDINAAGSGNRVGGSDPADRNLIAGHLGLGGVAVNGSQGTEIIGNHFGLGADGSTALGNRQAVLLINDVQGSVVGGSAAQGNTIAHSRGAAVTVASATGLAAVLGNLFHDNGGLAIDLAQDNQVQANDANDADRWQNMLQLDSALWAGGQLRLAGQLDSEAGRAVRIEYYVNDTPGALGHGEGQRLLASVDATVAANGRLVIDQVLATPVSVGQWISATVTRLDAPGGRPLSTSEFSAARQVTVVNLPPQFTSPGGSGSTVVLTVPENLAPVLSAQAVDPEGGALRYSLAGGADADRFSVAPGSGQLSFIVPPDFEAPSDANGDGRFELTLQVTDPAGLSDMLSLVLAVGNQNDTAPSVGAGQAFDVAETAPVGTLLGSLAATDADGTGDSFHWVLLGGNTGNAFTLDAASGQLSVADASALAAAPGGLFTLQVQVNDGQQASAVQAVQVRVNPVGLPPEGRDGRITLDEDGTHVLAAADFGFQDPLNSPPDQLAAVRISGLAGNGLLALNGVAVAVGQEITRADLDAGALTYTPASEANGTALFTLQFQLRDDGATRLGGSDLDPTPNTLWFDVTPVNDAPVLADLQITLPENSTAGTPLGTLVSGDADAGSVLRDFRITGGNGRGLFELDALTGQLRLAAGAVPDFETQALHTLRVSVSDGLLTSAEATVTVNLTDVNEAPRASQAVLALQAVQGQALDQALATAGFSDPDAGDTLRWQLRSATPGATPPAWLVVDATTGRLGGTPAQADVGTLDLQLVATDAAGLSAEITLQLSVLDRNDAPQGQDAVRSLQEDGVLVLGPADFGFQDLVDQPGHGLAAVRLGTLPQAGQLQLDGRAVAAGTEVSLQDLAAGRLRYLPPADASGTDLARLGFQVRDDGGTAFGGQDLDPVQRTLHLDVLAVDDAPVVLRNELDLAGGLVASPVIVVADPDTAPSQVRLSVAAVQGGQFTLAGQAGAVTSFTLEQVQAGQVRFERTLGAGTPGYQLVASDVAGGTAAASSAVVRRAEMSLEPVVAADAAPGTGAQEAPLSATSSATSSAAASPSGAPATGAGSAAPAAAGSAGTTLGTAASTRLAPASPALADLLVPASDRQADNRVNVSIASTDFGRLAADLGPTTTPAALRVEFASELKFGEFTLPGQATLQLSALAAGSSQPQADVAALVDRLDGLRRSLLSEGDTRTGELAGGTAMGLSLSVGYVVWLVRGGILASSMLAALPSWQMLDPLPMLGRLGSRANDDDNADGDQVEDLFARGQGAPAAQPGPASATPAPTDEETPR